MRIKLDSCDLSAVINGLYTMRNNYDASTKYYINDLTLRLIDIHDNLNPRRKAKIKLDGSGQSIILHCLVDWRNQFIQEGKPSAAEGVGELILKIAG